MICNYLHNLTGFVCHPIDEQGTLAQIQTPFHFADGDPLPVYVQSFQNNVVRFFDDGQVILHFMGRGMDLSSGQRIRFLKNIASKFGADINKDGVLEISSKENNPSDAFAKYIACLHSVASWESEHQNNNATSAAFVEEVIFTLQSIYPHQTIKPKKKYIGSSGKTHEVDFSIDDVGYFAIKPTQQSAAPALYKLVDISNRIDNESKKFTVIIDDRFDKSSAKNTRQVFRSIADDVIDFSKINRISISPMH